MLQEMGLPLYDFGSQTAGSSASDLPSDIYHSIADRPILSPHTHIPVEVLADPNARLGSPVDFFVIGDHYVLRLLYSHGVRMESLGVAPLGETSDVDHRSIWRLFASHFHLFAGTPSGAWIRSQLHTLFGIGDPLTAASADDIYDRVAAQLDATNPRALYELCNIEVLSTTDFASASLQSHLDIVESGWSGSVLPTFRPDDVTDLNNPTWAQAIAQLAAHSDIDISVYDDFIEGLRRRRDQFIAAGATATDHGAATPDTTELAAGEVRSLFDRALRSDLRPGDAPAFAAHMLGQMAAMSCDDGLVMQLHSGVWRDHNSWHRARYGEALGGDIPIRTDFTRSLHPLLNRYGNNAGFTFVVFTLDETTYARELAPLAGHYPAMRLGPPWWFNDSPNGIRRYLDSVVETAGVYNLVGFNDDARAFGSIPVRHDVWRRSCARWLAAQVEDGMMDVDSAMRLATELSDGLARSTYSKRSIDDT